MHLQELNEASYDQAFEALKQCCSSSIWCNEMIKNRPYGSIEEILLISKKCEEKMTEEDWKEAFAGHPMIGRSNNRKPKGWEANEQSGAASSSDALLDELENLNQTYYEKFGYIYIICATGKSGEEMLRILTSRVVNEPCVELRIAAQEQSKITQLRLQKLMISNL